MVSLGITPSTHTIAEVTKLTYGTWMFGHWHKDQDVPDYRARCLLDDVVEVAKR